MSNTAESSYQTPPSKKKSDKKQRDDDDDKQQAIFCEKIPASLPVVSLQQGLAKKATPLALKSWVTLALTLDGRDKITKIVQYSARILTWWYAASHQSQRFKSLQSSVTNSRKAYRLGRSFIELQKIRDSGFLQLLLRPLGKDVDVGSTPAWKIIGNALKMIGLMGFWAGDNVNFLTLSGLLDDYRPEVSQKARMEKRTQLKSSAAIFANRFYFFGCVAGLLTNIKTYWQFRQTTIQQAHQRLVEAVAASTKDTSDKVCQRVDEAKQALDKAQAKQFGLFVALLKSCVDVMVFSNNPGIDLWKKYRGKKNHEGFHCLCGLTSAATVLYNNYPDAK